jgi:hypothetical protein
MKSSLLLLVFLTFLLALVHSASTNENSTDPCVENDCTDNFLKKIILDVQQLNEKQEMKHLYRKASIEDSFIMERTKAHREAQNATLF